MSQKVADVTLAVLDGTALIQRIAALGCRYRNGFANHISISGGYITHFFLSI